MGQSESKNREIPSLAIVIIACNEELMIANCLATAAFADEILVVDSGSTDNTIEISRRAGANVIEADGGSFKDWRNLGKDNVSSDWILYIDADERVTPRLAEEIRAAIRFTSNAAFSLKRNNIHFGKWMQYGGWENDSLVRLFDRSKLAEWQGDVHEHAIIHGPTGELKEPLVHLTHRNLKDGLVKSATWTDIEARLLFEAGVGKVVPFTLVRKTMMEFMRRLIFKKGYKDGMVGWIESMQQAMNRFFVYERLWELQTRPTLEEKYDRMEKEIERMWRKQK